MFLFKKYNSKVLNALIVFAVLLSSCDKKIKNSNIHSTAKKTSSQNFLDSIGLYVLHPIDSIKIIEDLKDISTISIADVNIEISKKPNRKINWIRINHNKFQIDSLKTISPRNNGTNDDMYSNTLTDIKLYQYKNDTILFFEFMYSPCTGLACSVSDNLIFNINKNQINLFGNFRSSNTKLYNFPIDRKINYLTTEYETLDNKENSWHFISSIYSLSTHGKFYQTRDKKDKPYSFEITRFPDNSIKNKVNKVNWF